MREADIIKLIRQVVRQELAQETMGSIVNTSDEFRGSVKRFTNDAPMKNLRMIQPYGFASRPPEGTDCLVSPINGDVTHLNITGQFDQKRPKLDDGDSVLYGFDGQVVYMKKGGTIHQGTLDASEPVVLGNALVSLLSALLDAFINGVTPPTAIGVDSITHAPVFTNPVLVALLTALKTTYLTSPATNIVGQKNFVERGL